MTPDELPADMEAVRMRLGLLARDLERDNPWQGTRSAEDAFDLRALLKAYQEQRRALERIVNAADARITKRHIRDYAAEALNQKGDER
jgi:hypothetical protein